MVADLGGETIFSEVQAHFDFGSLPEFFSDWTFSRGFFSLI